MIRISNSQRMKKTQKYSLPQNRRQRTNGQEKLQTHYIRRKILLKFEYILDAQDTDSKVLAQMNQTFRSKLDLYLPRGRVNKFTRSEKYAKKQKLNFSIKMNPIRAIFQRLNQKLVRPVLLQSLNQLKVVNKPQKINKQKQ